MPPMPITKGCGRVGCYGPVVNLPNRSGSGSGCYTGYEAFLRDFSHYHSGPVCLGCCSVDAIPVGMVPEWRPDVGARARRFSDGMRQRFRRGDLTPARTSA
jgi:hypothetical protein